MAKAAPLRMVLLGAQGQLGHALAQTLPVLGQVLALGRQQADLAQAESLRALLDQHQPQLIVNAAAYTAVDKAEQEPGLAQAINAQAPAHLWRWPANPRLAVCARPLQRDCLRAAKRGTG